MKFLKFAAIFLALLCLLFLLAGILKPTIAYDQSIIVDKPIAEAWAVHKDTTKFSQWLKGFKSITHLSGKVNEVGSKYKVVVNPGEGQGDFEMIETIVSIKDLDHISLNFESDMMTFDQTTSYEEVNGETKITTSSTSKGKGFLMHSMFAIMDIFGSFEKQDAENMAALKKVINENTTDYYATPPVVEEMIE